MREFTCSRCGAAFKAYRDRKFCGRDCANKTRAESAMKEYVRQCNGCGTEIHAAGHAAAAKRFCAACAERRRSRQNFPCERCGTLTYRPPSSKRRYCSRECSAAMQVGRPSTARQGERRSSGVDGFRLDIGHYVRSRWEANYARYLLSSGSTYQYEPHRFTIRLADETEHTYTPDFLVDGAHYVEVKGFFRRTTRQAEIVEAARSQLPLPLIVVQNADYRAIERQHAGGISEWEYDGDPKPPLPKRLCPICGTVVKSIFRSTVYCSRACFGASTQKPKVAKQCQTCGVGFEVQPWDAGRSFCSRPCWYASIRGKVPAHTPRGGKLPVESKLKMIATKRAKRQP